MDVLMLHPQLTCHLDSKLKVFESNLLETLNNSYKQNSIITINNFYINNITSCIFLNNLFSVLTNYLFLPEISCHSGELNEYFPSIIFLNIIICLRCQNGGQPINL